MRRREKTTIALTATTGWTGLAIDDNDFMSGAVQVVGGGDSDDAGTQHKNLHDDFPCGIGLA